MLPSVPGPNGAESGGGGSGGGGGGGGSSGSSSGSSSSSSTCTPEADAGLAPAGRWVAARSCAATFGPRQCGAGGGGAASFRRARVWLPFGSGCGGDEARSARCAPDVRRCLAHYLTLALALTLALTPTLTLALALTLTLT